MITLIESNAVHKLVTGLLIQIRYTCQPCDLPNVVDLVICVAVQWRSNNELDIRHHSLKDALTPRPVNAQVDSVRRALHTAESPKELMMLRSAIHCGHLLLGTVNHPASDAWKW